MGSKYMATRTKIKYIHGRRFREINTNGKRIIQFRERYSTHDQPIKKMVRYNQENIKYYFQIKLDIYNAEIKI